MAYFQNKRTVKKSLGIVFFGVFFLTSVSFQNPPAPGKKEKKEFPRPEKTDLLLFYVQRTFNTNTIFYELNLNANQELNTAEPIKMHWVNYATDKSSEPLNYIQRKYAYGVDLKMIDAEKKSYCFNFVSYKKKKLYLIKSPVDNKYHVFCDINNKLVTLDRVFIQIEGGSFWVPKVRYIDISGRDLAKNEETIERVIP
jgi:hypothetical protein